MEIKENKTAKLKQAQKHIKYVNFDLSTEELRKHFGKNTAEPYELIKQFFESKGFEHRQYSGYISKEPLDDVQVSLIADELGANFIWIESCMQEFDIVNAPEKTSYKEQIKAGAEEKIAELMNKLQKEVKYYAEHKNSFYDDAKKKSKNTILCLYKELSKNKNIELDDKLLKIINTITNERGGKSL